MKAIKYKDGFLGETMERRSVGRCPICSSLIYERRADGEGWTWPDPRWQFGPCHAATGLVAREYGYTGPDVLMCADCSQDAAKYQKVLAIARKLWQPE